MFAYIGTPGMIADLLLKFGQLSLFGMSLDGKGHRDGWGIGYYPPCSDPSPDSDPGPPHLVKRAECALDSSTYGDTVHRVEAAGPSVVLAHLRKASPDTPVTIHETHPFLHGTMLFCHNGTIFSSGNQPLGPGLDSVQLFQKIRECSLEKAISFFWDYQYTSLSCMLTDGDTIWAYRDFRKDEEYYTVYYLASDSCVILCSEPLFPGGWRLLQNHELVSVSHDFQVRSTKLSSKSPAPRVP